MRPTNSPGSRVRALPDRVLLGRLVLQVAAGDRKMDPLLGIRAVDVDDSLERDARRWHIPGAKRALAQER